MKGLIAAAVFVTAATTLTGAPSAADDTGICATRHVEVSNVVVTEDPEGTGARLRFVVSAPGCRAGSLEYRTAAAASGPQATADIDYVPATAGRLDWVPSTSRPCPARTTWACHAAR